MVAALRTKSSSTSADLAIARSRLMRSRFTAIGKEALAEISNREARHRGSSRDIVHDETVVRLELLANFVKGYFVNTVSSNRRTLVRGLGTIVLALFLVTAMWVPVFAEHLVPPVSIQTMDQTVDGGTAVSLRATSSDDATHEWTATPNVGTFGNEAVEDTTWTAPATTTDDEVVALTLTVTESGHDEAKASVMITVRGAEPTVSIQTKDQTVFGGTFSRLKPRPRI